MAKRNAVSNASLRSFGTLSLFDPAKGTTVLDPPGAGKGWWVGAPSAIHDPEARKFYLYYRVRKPREFGRGGECRIAASDDGLKFTTIWTATKEQFNSPSIERSALVKCLDNLSAHRPAGPAGLNGLFRR